MTDRKNSFTAVIDSGVGGLSVIPALRRELPREDFLYFGDAKNAPYGEKTADEVRTIVDGIVGDLTDKGAKAVVLACNTATSAAAAYLREKYPVPIIGMEPALKPAAEAGERPRVLVMATPLTIREDKLHDLAVRLRDEADFIFVPCHGLVELVEAGEVDSERVTDEVKKLLAPHVGKIDSIVLGCTHYAHLKGVIKSVAGDGVKLFDGADGTARQTRRRLEEADLLSDKNEGSVTLTDSSPVPGYKEICKKLLSRLS